ncbi:MAG: fibronectin-binding domain-containing protein [Promethearchaeota archaeon]|nr:MAG: fibronectin-binding domain-containing protein [Candidatus Lokiarchaeota archaeon]
MKTIKSFTNVDVFAISKELDLMLRDSTISNVYEIEDLLILKINTKEGKRNLIIKRDTRINLTEYDYPIPKYPSQYIMSLRKFLKNRRILSVYQYNFDRIIIFELYNTDSEPWRFIIELFDKGNFILIDENKIIKVAKKYRKFKDRDVLAGKEYSFPLSRGKDFLTINQNDFKELIKNSDVEIVRFLARNINIAGLYSEEICYRAEVDKKALGKDLIEGDLNNLFKSFKNLRNQLLFGNITAQIVKADNGEQLFVIPFEIKMFNEFEKQEFDSFNNAVDKFYSIIDSEIIMKPSDEKIKEKIKSQKKILKNQLDYLEELKLKKKKYYEQGNFIYSNFNPLEELLNVIKTAKSKGYKLEEINNKLQQADLEKFDSIDFFKKIIPSTKQLVIDFNDNEIYLNLDITIGESASLIYEKGKKAEKKIKGTILALEKTKKNIEKLKLEKNSMETEVSFLIKKPKKKWFEKFRWFKSSDDFLVIGGRDASSNETVFKKYLDSNDLVFHTNFPGSPLAIIKNPENKEIPEKTILEAADFVASYSSAWKENWGVVDVFYVLPSQVSKSPPSGEYLPKGSFIISGKKKFIKKAKTELAISLEFIEMETDSDQHTKGFYPKILSAPINAIIGQSKNFIVIKPSKTGLSKGKLAKEIKNHFLKNSNKDMKKWLNLLSIDEIELNLPTGSSIII